MKITSLALGLLLLAGCSVRKCWVVESGSIVGPNDAHFARDYYYLASGQPCGWVQRGDDSMPNVYLGHVDSKPLEDWYFRNRKEAIRYVESYCHLEGKSK